MKKRRTKNKKLIGWRKVVKTTKTNWKKKKKKEEYQLFLELNNLYPVFQFFHIHSLFYTGHFTPFFFFSEDIEDEEGEDKEEGEEEGEGGREDNMKMKTRERKTKRKKEREKKRKKEKKEKKKEKLWMDFEEERVC